MAQEVIIDIIADTKKLTSGIDSANKQLSGMSKGLKSAAAAATGLASAFVLKQGVSFLKDGIEEAKDAAAAMRAATATFGAGSKALEQITKDADKFGKELAIDNDELIKLGTQLGSRLPREIQSSSVELVKIFKDVEAFTGGAVDAEGAGNKLAKAFADGELKAKELQKIFPSLNQSVYDQAEALSKAGKNQEAINLLTAEGAKKYGDAAAKNVDATQKFNVALDNFKETLGTKVLPILEKGIDFLTKMLDAFDALPGPVKNLVIGLTAVVGIGGPLLGFLASAKTAMVTLGLVSEGAALSTNIFSTALKAIPILAVIALIVLLVQNWDTVSAKAKEIAEAVAKWFGDIYDKVKEYTGKAINWVKENWPLLLGILTGPFGLFIVFLAKHKDELLSKFADIWDAITKNVVGFIKNAVSGWMSEFYSFYGQITKFFNKFAQTVEDLFGSIKVVIKMIVGNIIDEFGVIFSRMFEVGQLIAKGIMSGLTSMTFSFGSFLKSWINNNIPLAVRKILQISSPSKVMMKIGEYAAEGLYQGMGVKGPIGLQMPQINVGNGGGAAGINVTINAGLGTDPYTLGREITTVLQKYGRISVRPT